jgi:hypothetical protein
MAPLETNSSYRAPQPRALFVAGKTHYEPLGESSVTESRAGRVIFTPAKHIANGFWYIFSPLQ